jgi:hypothetical protein
MRGNLFHRLIKVTILIINLFCSSIDKDDSINGSKTQSATTTESNTPENTVRLDNMATKSSHNHRIENGEVVLEGNFQNLIIN